MCRELNLETQVHLLMQGSTTQSEKKLQYVSAASFCRIGKILSKVYKALPC